MDSTIISAFIGGIFAVIVGLIAIYGAKDKNKIHIEQLEENVKADGSRYTKKKTVFK